MQTYIGINTEAKLGGKSTEMGSGTMTLKLQGIKPKQKIEKQ